MGRFLTTGALAAAAVVAVGLAGDASAQSGGINGWFQSFLPAASDQQPATPVQAQNPGMSMNNADAPVFDSGAAEWGDRFDPSSEALNFTFNSQQPTLNPNTVQNIQWAVANYQTIAAQGGWGMVPEETMLRIGIAHPNVAALRQRLIASGDLNNRFGVSETFDSYVEAAVRRFQTRHGLVVDGIVRDETFEALNVPVEQRIQQLQNNLARVGTLPSDLGSRYVLVNIPAAEVEAVADGVVASRHTAVVGKIDRQSPILSRHVQTISFNPFWTVPKSIIQKDIIPKMREEPDYLTKYKIRIYNNQGQELDPTTVDWNTDEAVNYMLRQDPGDQNSLGLIRINFPNEHAVYLHDTPQQNLFGTNNRFHSSGCVRVQNVRQLVNWLLEPTQEWSRSRIDAVVRSGEQHDVRLQRDTPIYFQYVTAWATSDGVVNFRPDIYNFDGFGAAEVASEF